MKAAVLGTFVVAFTAVLVALTAAGVAPAPPPGPTTIGSMMALLAGVSFVAILLYSEREIGSRK